MRRISINDLPLDMEISEEEKHTVTGGLHQATNTYKKKELKLSSSFRSPISVTDGTKSDKWGYCDTATAGVRG